MKGKKIGMLQMGLLATIRITDTFLHHKSIS